MELPKLSSLREFGTGADVREISRAYARTWPGPNQQVIASLPLLMTASEIEHCVKELAKRIARDYGPNGVHAGKPLVLVGILKGVFVFLADLARALSLECSVYFIEASSYGDAQTQGAVRFLSTIEPSKFAGRQVLLVDELFDNGKTMHGMREALLKHPELSLDASDVHTCALFSKDSGSELAQPDYVGIAGLPALWLVGYGLDAQGNYRGLPHLYAVPKAEGVPRCPADGLFASDGSINMELYHAIRKKILSDMISAQLD